MKPVLTAAGVLLVATFANAQKAPEGDPAWMTIGVRGVQQGEGTYQVRLHYRPGDTGQRVDAILVYAEPAHRLLVTQWHRDPSERERQTVADGRGLASTSIDAGRESRFATRIPFDARGSTGFSVEVLHDGELLPLMSNARTTGPDCGLSITFDAAELLSSLHLRARGVVNPLAKKYKVCCGSGECKRCIDCVEDPPSPSCSCPGCDVSCT